MYNINMQKYCSFFCFYSYIFKEFLTMDTRLIVIAAPILVAGGWALFNIGRLAIQQIQRLSN